LADIKDFVTFQQVNLESVLGYGAEVVDFVKELTFNCRVKDTETQFSKHNINPNFMNLCQVRDIICRILKDIHDYCKKFVDRFGNGLWDTEKELRFKKHLEYLSNDAEIERLPRKPNDRGEEIILGNEMKEEVPNE